MWSPTPQQSHAHGLRPPRWAGLLLTLAALEPTPPASHTCSLSLSLGADPTPGHAHTSLTFTYPQTCAGFTQLSSSGPWAAGDSTAASMVDTCHGPYSHTDKCVSAMDTCACRARTPAGTGAHVTAVPPWAQAHTSWLHPLGHRCMHILDRAARKGAWEYQGRCPREHGCVCACWVLVWTSQLTLLPSASSPPVLNLEAPGWVFTLSRHPDTPIPPAHPETPACSWSRLSGPQHHLGSKRLQRAVTRKPTPSPAGLSLRPLGSSLCLPLTLIPCRRTCGGRGLQRGGAVSVVCGWTQPMGSLDPATPSPWRCP